MKQLSKNIHPLKERPIKILQFGEGNFLRAFVDDFIQNLNDQNLINANIVVVQPMPSGRVAEMKKQDGLYTLMLEGLQNGQIVKTNKIIDCLADFIDPFTEYDKYLKYARSQELEIIVSNTTEAGIVYVEENILNGLTPKSFPGKLLALLFERYHAFNADLTKGLDIVPCELIDYNGDQLKDILIKLAQFNKLEVSFIDWISKANRFYNTLVDRIVPGYPVATINEIQKSLGYEDNSLVMGEIFHLWVIEGSPVLQTKLPFAKSGLNVHYVDSIVPYKQQKVKILNGSHTALVPISYLLGNTAVKESMADERVAQFVDHFVYQEVIPTINLEKSVVTEFANSVIERYKNPFIHHLLMSIALNSISKYKSRIIPTIEDSLKNNVFPKYALFSLAALIKFYSGVDEKGQTIKLADDQFILDFFKEVWLKERPCCVTKNVLAWDFWQTDSFKNDMVVEFVTNALRAITNEGVANALEKLKKGAL